MGIFVAVRKNSISGDKVSKEANSQEALQTSKKIIIKVQKHVSSKSSQNQKLDFLNELDFSGTQFPADHSRPKRIQNFWDKDLKGSHAWHKYKDNLSPTSCKNGLPCSLVKKVIMRYIETGFQNDGTEHEYSQDLDDCHQRLVVSYHWSQIGELGKTPRNSSHDIDHILQTHQRQNKKIVWRSPKRALSNQNDRQNIEFTMLQDAFYEKRQKTPISRLKGIEYELDQKSEEEGEI